jgi:nicotinamide mononucleotide transporter
MSTLEWVAFVVNVLCVALIVAEKDVNWPIGVAGSVALACVMWQGKFYAQFGLMIFYILECLYGWWMWTRRETRTGMKLVRIGKTRAQTAALLAALGTLATAALYPLFLHTGDPFPFWDCAILVASLIAEYMLCLKLYESWAVYFAADVASIILFASVGLWITAGTYALFTVLCVLGIFAWRRSLKTPRVSLTPALSSASSAR